MHKNLKREHHLWAFHLREMCTFDSHCICKPRRRSVNNTFVMHQGIRTLHTVDEPLVPEECARARRSN